MTSMHGFHRGIVLILFACLGRMAFAGHTVHLIGVTAASQAMGGTGVGIFQTAPDAMHKNPALLNLVPTEKGEFSVAAGGTLLDLNASVGGTKSAAKPVVNGAIAGTYRISPDAILALGAYGYGGSTFNYANQATLQGVESTFRLFRVGPAAAFALSKQLHLGIAAFVNVGAFKLNEAATGTQSTRKPSTGLGFGGQVGLLYREKGWQVGLAYTSASRVRYKDLIDLDLFLLAPNPNGLDRVTVTQPHEIALGFGFGEGALRAALDYRLIMWGSAMGYQEFGFRNQHVISAGGEWQVAAPFKIRGGYAFSTKSLKSVTGENAAETVNYEGKDISKGAVSLLDATAFAGIVQHSITLGGEVRATDDFAIHFSALYSPRSSLQRAGAPGPYDYQTRLTKWAASVALTFNQ